MTKHDLEQATIKVFGNGTPLIHKKHYEIINAGPSLSCTYPALTAINTPFDGIYGGYEEGKVGFNSLIHKELSSVNIFHNKKIATKNHDNYDKKPYNVNWERPDIFEVGSGNMNPSYNGKHVESAVQVGHNFVSQSANGIFDKICHELWRLQQSDIKKCFFIGLYTHLGNLAPSEQLSLSADYIIPNIDSDNNYELCLKRYRNDIGRIDPNYTHLVFKGTRKKGLYNYYTVLILELPTKFSFNTIFAKNGNRIRP